MECLTELQLREMFEERIAPEEREAFEAHISECARCRRLVVEVARGLSAFEPVAPEVTAEPVREVEHLELTGSATLQDRYVILDIVGMGGMGVVYAAYDRKLDRKVAIKLLRPEVASTGDGGARLLREAQVVARLSHPNIINVHDVGEIRGQIFIDMEFVDGCTLRQWLAKVPRPSTGSIVWVFLEAGRGLAAAHAAGVIHRDFKPDNVLIGRDGRVRVNDFGLARSLALSELSESELLGTLREVHSPLETRTAGRAGTPAYMAPEQRRGEPATAAADQYAYCVALHEALFGERPVADQAGRSRIGKREQMRNLRLTAVLQRGLSPDPRARFPSMDALVVALARASRPSRWPAYVGAGVVAVGLGFWAMSPTEPASPCRGAEVQIRDVWNEARKEALLRSFEATAVPGASAGFESIARVMDRYAEAWVAAHRQSCEATHVFLEQSAELLDRRMTCLHRDLDDVDALLDVLLDADAATIERVPEIVANIDAPAQCVANDALLMQAPAPPPGLRERVDANRARVGEAVALSIAGRSQAALAAAQRAAAEAVSLGFPPSEQRAMLALGRAQMGVGAYAEAERSFRRALLVAESIGQDGQALEGWLELTWSVSAQARYEEAAQHVQHAEAKVNRLGANHPSALKRRADVVHAQADLHLARGRMEEALEAYRQALALRRREPDGNPTAIATSLNALGNLAFTLGDENAAMGYYREALAIRERVFGPDHPRVAGILNNIGRTLQAECAWTEARASLERAMKIRSERYGRDHTEIAGVLSNLAALEEEQGRHAEAVAAALESLAMLTRLLGVEHPIRAGALTILARLRLAEGAVEEALALAEAANELVARHLGARHPEASEPQLALGSAQLAAGRSEEAVQTLEQAWELVSTQPSRREWRARVAFALAQALWARGEQERARVAAGWAQVAVPTCREAEAVRIADWIAAHAPAP